MVAKVQRTTLIHNGVERVQVRAPLGPVGTEAPREVQVRAFGPVGTQSLIFF